MSPAPGARCSLFAYHSTRVSRVASRPINVWIVDDDQSVRWVLEKALKQADMETRSFERAEHLLEALGDAEPDVLITDVRMPGMTVIALLDRLQGSYPDLPVIVITAHSDLENAVAAYKGGAFEYLPSPLTSTKQSILSARRRD